ncbi:MAG: response regulator [Pseudomonadota bacterium]
MKKILIADDSLFMRTMLKDILARLFDAGMPDEGCAVFEAATGTEAFEKFLAEKPDLVLLDVIMPGREEEGVALLGDIMDHDPGSRVVMITAIEQDEMMEKCRELGAKGYVVKPFDEKQVADVVRKCLG